MPNRKSTPSLLRRMSDWVWQCCQCSHTGMAVASTPGCPDCGHIRCRDCSLENIHFGSDPYLLEELEDETEPDASCVSPSHSEEDDLEGTSGVEPTTSTTTEQTESKDSKISKL